MRAIKRWRYFCDHCKTSKGTKSSMELHEAHCTKNPRRSCRMCDYSSAEELIKKGVALVKEHATDGHDPEGYVWGLVLDDEHLNALRKLCDYCPACVLSCLRQGNKEGKILSTSFDYKEEAASYLKQKREDAMDNYAGGYE